MAVLEMTSKNVKETIDSNEMVFIDFWAPWCGPCRNFAPVFEGVALKHPDLKFAKVNTEVEAELAGQFGIMSIPTLGIFKDKELIFLQPGALPEEVLTEIVQKVREINMDEVRANNAEETADDKAEK